MDQVTAAMTGLEVLEHLRMDTTETSQFVEAQAGRLVAILHSTAPLGKTGNLRAGIVASPWEEKTAVPGKVVREVYFDYNMNDVFVKYSKAGKRYYYPASMEYGFRIHTMTPSKNGRPRASRIPGKYFMRDSSIEFAPAYRAAAEQFVSEVASRG